MRAGVENIAGAALAALLGLPAAAQLSEAPRAPRILDQPPGQTAPRTSAEADAAPQRPVGPLPRPPNAARLAPLPEERRSDEPDEIIVIGQSWRLPDLGSEWRARQQEAAKQGRFAFTALPLYDPERPPLRSEFFATPEERRHGYIEIFRFRFGRRSRD